jgi:hypothetical protein
MPVFAENQNRPTVKVFVATTVLLSVLAKRAERHLLATLSLSPVELR